MADINKEVQRIESVGWLRAAVLGANDGIVSTSCLILGVAASNTTHHNILVAGIAGLVSGAMSMAAGEYVSVHSQADTEAAALEQERGELKKDPESEQRELTAVYIGRGLDPALARQVAEQLIARDPLGSYARDELGLTETLSARPLQAALASACSFSTGAALPLLVVALASAAQLIPLVSGASLLFLAFLGGLAAHVGGASVGKGVLRVTFWSALAMAVTAGIGALVGKAG
jgi:VIT1/CCC1 family predicted Fe2+/Mn2+ transporter